MTIKIKIKKSEAPDVAPLLHAYEAAHAKVGAFRDKHAATLSALERLEQEAEAAKEQLTQAARYYVEPPKGAQLHGQTWEAARGDLWKVSVTYKRKQPYYKADLVPSSVFLFPGVVESINTERINEIKDTLSDEQQGELLAAWTEGEPAGITVNVKKVSE